MPFVWSCTFDRSSGHYNVEAGERERERERVRVFVRVRVCVCVCACVRVRVRACVPDWLTVCGVRAATTDKRRETRGQSVKQNDTPSV